MGSATRPGGHPAGGAGALPVIYRPGPGAPTPPEAAIITTWHAARVGNRVVP